MNADRHGDDDAEPGDDAVAAAFAAYKTDASAAFPPPSVDDLIMSGPAALRRRRIVSLAAVVGACTALTAGGFAVAQTLGSLPQEPDQGPPTAVQGSPSSETDQDTQLGDPVSPEVEDEPAGETTETADAGAETTALAIADWDGVCAGGSFDIELETWAFTGDTDWSVAQGVSADVTGDDRPETVLSLTCGDRTAVAAFADGEDGLDQLAWVWQPDESHELSEIVSVEAGVITLEGLGADAATWTARYEWDGAAFVAIDDGEPTEPSQSETAGTPEPGETPSSDAASTEAADQ